MDVKTVIYRYCNYRERCHAEVRNKLYELKCTTPEVEEHIADLISTGLLNEERYAKAFARGHFRLKKWGKQKIRQNLKQNRISDYCLKKALAEIDEEEYENVLKQLAGKKWSELKSERNQIVRKGKTYRYLIQKGYEGDLVNDVIKELPAG